MNNTSKTKEQLVEELSNCHQKISILEKEALEIKKRELSFQDSEKKYKVLIEYANFPIFTVNKKGIFLFLNKEAARTFKGKPLEFVGKTMWDLFPKKLADLQMKSVRKTLETGKPAFSERESEIKGEKYWFDVNIQPLKNSEGKYDRALVMVTDITRYKKVEMALRESETKYRTLVNNATDFIYMIDKYDRILSVNKASAKLFGKETQEITGSSIFDLFPRDIANNFSKNLRKVFQTGKPYFSETQMVVKKTRLWTSVILSPVKDEKGLVTSVMGITRNISENKKIEEELQKSHIELEKKINERTAELKSVIKSLKVEIKERKEVEAELSESEKQFKTLFEFAPDAYYLIDLRGNIIDGNRTAEKLIGYKKNEVAGKNILRFKILSPDQVLKAIKLLARNAQGKGTGPDEFNLNTKQGKKKEVEILTHPVKIKNRIVVLGIARDITQRKQAERELRESQTKLRNLFDSVNEGIFAIDLNGFYIQANKRLAEMHGLHSANDMVGKNSFDFVAPGNIAKAREGLQKVFEKDIIVRQEYTALRVDGTECLFEISASMMKDDLGNPIGILGTATNITERKKAEKALQDSEEKYRSMVENINDVIFNTDEKGKITFISPKIKDLTGFSPDKIINQTLIKFISPEDRTTVIKRFSDLKSGHIESIEYRLVNKNGDPIWVYSSSRPQFAGKQFLGITGILTDITDKKRSEKIIQQNTERLKKAQNIAQMGFLDWNLKKNELLFSDQLYKLFGIKKYDGHYNPEKIMQLIHPDDLELVQRSLNQAIQGKKQHNLDHRILRPDGKVIWVHAQAELTRDKNGKPKSLLGTLFDITRRKQAEIAQLKEKQKAQQYLDIAGVIIIALSKKGEVTLINQKGCQILGYKEEEIIGKNWFKNFIPISLKNEVKPISKKLLHGEMKDSEYHENPILTKSGEERLIAWHNTLLKDEKGFIIGTLSSGEDITVRKKATDEIEMRQQYLESVLNSTPDAMITLDPNHHIVEWNPGAEWIFGYTRDETIGKNPDSLITRPDVIDEAEAITREAVAGKKILPREAVRYRKDGTPIKVIVSGSPIVIGKELIGFLAVYTDITELKKTEEALIESEKKYRQVVEQASDLILTTDVNGNWQFSNEAMLKISGYSWEEVEKMNYLDLIAPEYQNRVRIHYFRQFLKKQPSSYIEFPWITKSGKVIWFASKANLIIENDKVVGFHAISRDITEQKKAEQALQESERNYRNLIETSNDGIYLLHNRKFEIVNKKFQQMMNMNQEELNNPEFDVLDLVAPKSQPLIEERIKKSTRGIKLNPTYEFTALTKDKKEIEIETTVSYVKYKEGIATLGIFRDISERKRMEYFIERINQLKERLLKPSNLNKKLKLITDDIVEIFNVDFARIWLIDQGDRCDSGCFHAQKTKKPLACRIKKQCLHLKVSSGRYTHTKGKIHQRIPFDWYKIGQIATGKKSRFLTNNIQKDKNILDHEWANKLSLVSFACYRLHLGGKEPTGVMALFSKHIISPSINDLIQGVANTTTQVIQNSIAEKSLQISEQRFASIFNTADDGILYLNKKGKVLEVNPSLLRLTGISRKEVIDKNAMSLARKFIKPKEVATLLLMMSKALKGQPIKPYELEYKDKFFEVSVPLLKGSSGITGIIHDVTEIKLAMKKIQHSLEEKEILLQEIHHRVKNNLMIIIGLLNYYSINIEDENINKIMNNLQNTIHSMALIHEKLYRQEAIAKIDFVYYVKDLTNHLLGIHTQYMGKVNFHIKIEKIYLNLSTAIPCGMIINELVSNSLKHAFPEVKLAKMSKRKIEKHQKFTIQVMITKGKMLKSGKINLSPKGWYHLKISDNGIGLPVNFNLKNSQTLGLRLVNLMVEQLEGQIRIEKSNTTCFHINFKEQ